APDEEDPREILGIIGLSGIARGTVALRFPVGTALNVVNRLLSTDIKIPDDTVADAIAEMVNIVAGSAKSKLRGEDSPPIDLSLPTVVRGKHYHVAYPSGAAWVEVPFSSELGTFRL